MIKKIYLLSCLLAFCFLSVNAQDDAFVKTGISDEMTQDPEQNKMWKMGQTNYSAKPKSAWELGVHIGHALISGDVDSKLPGGYGIGLHLRKAIHYVFSIRADLFYGQMKGLDPQAWTHSSQGGGLVESTYSSYANENGWFPSTKTTYIYGALQGVINIGNLLFHKDRNKWNWYATIGVGLDTHKANLDLLGSDGLPYSDLISTVNALGHDFDTRDGRKQIKDFLNTVYDGEYETEGPKKKGIFRLGDDTNIHLVWTTSMGISRKLSKRFNIGLEHQIMLTDNDFLDGIKNRSAVDQTNNLDIIHYTNIRLGINLGNLDKVTEPLYWLNPLQGTFNDIAELKQRPILDLTDEDGDGIIDMLDQELDTPAGCPVDTRGVTLDSDGDGYADCKDEEPYSPPGFDVDSKGVAAVPTITEDDVNTIVDNKTSAMMNTVNTLIAGSDCGKWFLPMIHFDLDRYNIKPEFYGQLHHVATVMKMCPNVCVSAVGHTDARNSNDYNKVLSYNRAQATVDYLVTNYGIERNRFKLMYGGEDAPMMGAEAKSETQHYMNRRVEFRVCGDSDIEMERPEGPNAGKGDRTTRSASGSTYSGNKNSGY